jgi:protocatechuate 3,4-dioxygenase beta subunit
MPAFIVAAAIVSATHFAASAQPAPSKEKAATASDANDPKLVGRFSGQVTGADGKPLSGARVYISRLRGESNAPGSVRARTDSAGRFEFDAPDMTYAELDGVLSRREGLLIVTANGYGPEWRETSGLDGLGLRSDYQQWNKVKLGDVNFQLEKGDVTIHGRFLDADGRALAGARVRLERILIPRDRDLDAYLEAEKNRSPVTASDYMPSIDAASIPGLTTETKTDAEGRFTLKGLGRDRLAVLHVSAPSVVDTTLTVMTRDAPDVDTIPDFNGRATHVIHGAGFTLRLNLGLTIKGLVRDRDTKAPIAGMWVAWRHNPLLEGASAAGAAVTDEKGRFTLTGLPTELWNLDKSYRIVTAIPRPGGQYGLAEGVLEPDADVIIECTRGMPYRLKLVDEDGKPVQAKVEYRSVGPNPQVDRLLKSLRFSGDWLMMNRAAPRADGTYEGFALPGPGAVLVKTPDRSFRPAHVDPKAFFAPGKKKWEPSEENMAYGTNNTLSIGGQWTDQHDYAAIVLVNPEPNAKPLELSATVAKDRPRRVSLIDSDGKPVLGAVADGLKFEGWGGELTLRAASFPLTKLHPDRTRRITFIQEERKLIGFLLARGDADTPYTVRMAPWATVTGRIVDENGKPLPQGTELSLSLDRSGFETNTDPEVGEYAKVEIDASGRFKVDRMVPGQRYTVEIYRRKGAPVGMAGMAFEKLALRSGEVRDLGDIAMNPKREKK